MIAVTDNAVKHLRDLLKDRSGEAGLGLRLLVQKGGCAGMEYAMKLDMPQKDDRIFDHAGVNIIVDAASLAVLDGSSLDYQDTLNESGFKVNNPNASRSCGCGSSFEPKTEG
ncbi:iron-sulfur cluster assembly protein IscA [soil metagenome]